MFVFSTVLLTYKNYYTHTWYNSISVWFLDIKNIKLFITAVIDLHTIV